MTVSEPTARENQRRRTRKDLLQAAARLMKEGRTPTLDEVAEAALVSRATAYRYFPNIESLLVEAPLDVAVPDAETLFRSGPKDDPVARVERVDAAIHDAITANEPTLRMMLVHSLQQRLRSDGEGILARQNRRTPLIEAALRPARGKFKPAALDTLTKALALVIGTESTIAFKDVLQLDDAEARKVRRWMIRALIEAATKPRTID
jgi:AcrR family transcriptional regulator